MFSRFGKLVSVLIVLAVILPLAACGTTATPTATPVPPTTVKATTAPTAVPATAAPTKVPATATAVPPTATAAPATGGKFIIGAGSEPSTLDPALSNARAMDQVMELMGDALISYDPTSGKFVPWLAQSWTASSDGMTLTFKLRQDVKYTDGTPCTAKDFEYTFNRALDPATASIGTGAIFASMQDAKAIDNYTLEIHMKEPLFTIFLALAMPAYGSPLPSAYMEKNGAEKYGHNPMGEGMYKFVSWQTGVSIVLQRNPDYKWGPSWVTGPYADTIEFRFIPEQSTLMAALEAGEIDYALVPEQNIARIKGTNNFNLFSALGGGNPGYIQFNQAQPLFQNLNFKKALAMAIDRKPIIQAAYNGNAIEMYGPVTSTTAGYDPIQETYGYKTDVAGAKALLQQDGWVAGSDGILAKDGKQAKFILDVFSSSDTGLKMAQIIQQQWKAIGVQADLQQLELGTVISDMGSGKYEATMMGLSYSDFDVIPGVLGGNEIGGGGFLHVADPMWNELLKLTRTTMDPAKRVAAVNDASKYMMQNVLIVSIAAVPATYAVSKKWDGYILSSVTGAAWIYNVHLVK